LERKEKGASSLSYKYVRKKGKRVPSLSPHLLGLKKDKKLWGEEGKGEKSFLLIAKKEKDSTRILFILIQRAKGGGKEKLSCYRSLRRKARNCPSSALRQGKEASYLTTREKEDPFARRLPLGRRGVRGKGKKKKGTSSLRRWPRSEKRNKGRLMCLINTERPGGRKREEKKNRGFHHSLANSEKEGGKPLRLGFEKGRRRKRRAFELVFYSGQQGEFHLNVGQAAFKGGRGKRGGFFLQLCYGALRRRAHWLHIRRTKR